MINLYQYGDLLGAFENNKFDAIVHGCNCFHTMGAGIARAVKNRFYDAYLSDLKTEYGDWSKLGTYSVTRYVHGDIINAYTQYNLGKCPVDELYENIAMVFSKINEDYKGKTIGIPKIGCGIAGGDWAEVYKIINENTPDVNVIVYYL